VAVSLQYLAGVHAGRGDAKRAKALMQRAEQIRAGTALPRPRDDRGSIGVRVRLRLDPTSSDKIYEMFLPGQKAKTLRVHFARLGDNAKTSTDQEWSRQLSATQTVVSSNFADAGQIYLLNAKPGRYVAVAATFGFASGLALADEAVGLFPVGLISQTEVVVDPGSMVFAGDFILRYEEGSYHAIHEQLAQALGVSPGSWRVVGLGRVKKDPEVETDFWNTSRRVVFAEAAAWAEFVPNPE
jgi:hypothetical protein